MTVHIISETEFVHKKKALHAAFINHVEMMKEKKDIDVVINGEGTGNIFHSHTYGPYFFWKGQQYKGRRVYTVHASPDSLKGTLPLWKYWLPIVKWYFKQVYSYADVCIAISPQVEKAIKDLGLHTRVVKIYNPVNTEKWKYSEEKKKAGRKMFSIEPHEFVVLGVGHIHSRKGVEDFIDVAENIPEARFMWVGGRPFKGFSEETKKLNKRMRKAPSNLQFTGLLEFEKMPYVYAACDMLLFPSYQENCPPAPLEAAACGKPVVFRDIMEYMKLYQNPYIKASNNEEFTQIIRKWIYDKRSYSEAVEISKQLIDPFDKEVIRKKLISLYYEIINDNTNYQSMHYFKDIFSKQKTPETLFSTS